MKTLGRPFSQVPHLNYSSKPHLDLRTPRSPPSIWQENVTLISRQCGEALSSPPRTLKQRMALLAFLTIWCGHRPSPR